MTLDPSIPSHLIDADEPPSELYEPRATRLVHQALASHRTAIWMGGVHTTLGDVIEADALLDAWVVDCAGEWPGFLAAPRLLPRVFADIEVPPLNIERLHATADELGALVKSAEAPSSIYVVCKQGLNRSGLVTGLLLTALGVPAADAIELMRTARPGALNNVTFARILLELDR